MNLSEMEDPKFKEWLDGSLEQLELEPLPPGFVERTMARIDPPQMTPFRLSWLDFGFAFVVAAVGTVTLFLISYFLGGNWESVLSASNQVDAETRNLVMIISTVIALFSLLFLLPAKSIPMLGQANA